MKARTLADGESPSKCRSSHCRTWIRRATSWRLPDTNAALGWQPELVAFFHAERVVELGQVADHAVASELGRRVRVRRKLPAHRGVPVLGPPDLGPADEQP